MKTPTCSAKKMRTNSAENYKNHTLPFSFHQIAVKTSRVILAAGDSELIEIVTKKPKQTVKTLEEVPQELITRVPIRTSMIKPKTLHSNYVNHPWHPQFEEAFILHVPNAFIGDNVIFDKNRYYSLGRWWLGNDWSQYKNTQTIRSDSWVISIAAWGGEAFQHFILDAVPKLAAVINLLESPLYQHIKIASHIKNCPFAQWFWAKLGLIDRVIQKPINAGAGVVISAEMALYPDFSPSFGNFGFYPRGTLLPIQHRLGLLNKTKQDLIVYLARDHKRSVANEDDVLTTITKMISGSKYELYIFRPSGSYDEDLRIISRAKVILGPHGGAFANIVFSQPGSHVIEFVPIYKSFLKINTSGRNYWGLAQAAGLHYWAVDPDNFSFNQPGMRINCEDVTRILEEIL